MLTYDFNTNKLPSEKSLQPIKVDVFRSALGQRRIQLPTDIPEVNVSPRLYASVRGFQRLFSNPPQRQQTKPMQTPKPIQYQQPIQPITTPVTPQNTPAPENEFMPAPVNQPTEIKQKKETTEIKPGEQPEI